MRHVFLVVRTSKIWFQFSKNVSFLICKELGKIVDKLHVFIGQNRQNIFHFPPAKWMFLRYISLMRSSACVHLCARECGSLRSALAGCLSTRSIFHLGWLYFSFQRQSLSSAWGSPARLCWLTTEPRDLHSLPPDHFTRVYCLASYTGHRGSNSRPIHGQQALFCLMYLPSSNVSILIAQFQDSVCTHARMYPMKTQM